MTDILVLENLKKSFGAKHVLDGVDLSVAPGKSLVIIGGSGSGKSVSLKCAIGLMRPDSGRVLVDGIDLHAARPKERDALKSKFGMLFQGGALFDSLRVWENIAFRLTHADHMPRPQARDAAIEALAKVGMPADVGNLYPGELSGGMQKRVSLARAIVAQPAILFFDEPTTGLDPIMADVIDRLIVEQVKRLGAAAGGRAPFAHRGAGRRGGAPGRPGDRWGPDRCVSEERRSSWGGWGRTRDGGDDVKARL